MSDNGFLDNVSWEGMLVGGAIGYLAGSRTESSGWAEAQEQYKQQVLQRGHAAAVAAENSHMTPELAAAIEQARLVMERRLCRAHQAEFAKRASGYRKLGDWFRLALWSPVWLLVATLLMFPIVWVVQNRFVDFLWMSLVAAPLAIAVVRHRIALGRTTPEERRLMHRHGRGEAAPWHIHELGEERHVHTNELIDPPVRV